jgi:UDP-N-acetylmuramate--alanine ligase
MLTKKNTHLHFIGICGIGMSGIAKILLQTGHKVSGCDSSIDPERANELQNLGCAVNPHQSKSCFDASITGIVKSSDVANSHPEIIAANKRNIPVHLRAEILAKIMSTKTSIAVAGAHGKTTTSSLLAHVLLFAKLDPTIIVGGHIHQLASNAHAGSGEFLVAESDESDRSFLLLPKKFTIVTNIDREHLNTYQDFNDIKKTFVQFINQLPSDGCNIICADDLGIQTVRNQITTPCISYGTTTTADFYIQNVQLLANFSTFELTDTRTNQDLGTFKVSLPGMHNVLNSTGVIALCLKLGVNPETIKNALETFQGVDRRFTFKGLSKSCGAQIFDDYGHHPTEIQATLKVAQTKALKKIIMVFQPQRYSRTKHLWSDFVQVLAQAPINQLIITDIFPANETPVDGITSQNMVQEILKLNPQAQVCYIPFEKDGQLILNRLDKIMAQDDLVLFQGAGKVNKLIPYLL